MQNTTIAAVASEIASTIAEDDHPMAVRLALDFARLWDREPPDRRAALVAQGPLPCGDSRYDALLAAIVEHLCERDGLPAPSWALDPSRFLETWWFVSGMQRLHATALVQSPISFARRGVFVCDGALSYA